MVPPSSDASLGKLILWMAAFVVVSIPLVAILWETLNDVLALRFDGARLLVGLPVLAAFAGVLWLLRRWLQRPAPDSSSDSSTP